MEKICSKCKVEKDVSCFRKYSRTTDGHQSVCKQCKSTKKDIICPQCGKLFMPKQSNQKFCSKECFSIKRKETRRRYSKTEKWKKTRRSSQSAYKARKKISQISKVNYDEINKRDNNTCQLCHKKVNMELEHPHPMSKSYDHIIPLSLEASEHSTRNLQLTHLVCNIKKQNHISNGVQMHLF